MTDLTEQWKNGELPSSDDDHYWLAYYIKHKDGYIHADSLWRGQWGIADRSSIEEILAKVPSYEEWQRILHYASKYEYEYTACVMDYENLKEENTKLKELLKECKRQFEEVVLYRYDVTDDDLEDWFKISTEQASVADRMITKINQALGEDK